MRSLIFGDVHAHRYTRYTRPDSCYGTNRVANIVKSVYWIRDLAKRLKPDRVIFLGDIVEDKESVQFNVYNLVLEAFWAIASEVPEMLLIVGNHDVIDRNSKSMNGVWYPSSALTPLSVHPKITVINKFTDLGGNEYAMPYTKTLPDEWKSLPDNSVLFTHIDVKELKFGNKSAGDIELARLGSRLVISGHLHSIAKIQSGQSEIYYIGALLPNSHKQDGEFLYGAVELDNNSMVRYPNPHSWSFRTVKVENGNFDEEKIEVPEYAYVRYITDNTEKLQEILKGVVDKNKTIYSVLTSSVREKSLFATNKHSDLEMELAEQYLRDRYPEQCTELLNLLETIRDTL